MVIGLASVIAAASASTPPGAAEEPETSTCVEDGAVLQERGESSALELAVECGAEVLIRDSQDYTTRSYAQPDGSIATEFAVQPQWVPDGTGEWIDADPTIEVAADGTLQTKATITDLEFGSAGDTAFVTATNADGESVALDWTEPLPEPELDGSTVRYPEVLPDVDLEVYAGVSDFSYALVVKTSEAAADPALERVEIGLASEGLSVTADAATDTAALSDADGATAFSVDTPWMWDSSAVGEGSGNAAPMELEVDADSLTVTPDPEFLADDGVEYPIYIDPKFRDENGASFENAFSQRTGITCGSGSEMCVGAQLWEPDNAMGYWRSAMKFTGLNSIANRDVQKANVLVTQTHTGGAGATQSVRLYAMNWWDFTEDTSMTTFNNQAAGLVATESVRTSNTGAGESDQTIEWADDRSATWVQKLVDAGNNTAVFGVLSGANLDQEKNLNYWRKLNPSTAKLVVWHAPLKPTQLFTNGSSCSTSAPGPTINTLTPTLKATAPASLRSTNELNFYVYERNGVPDNHLRKVEVANVSAGASVTVSVPSGVLERGQTYRWRTRAWDTDGEDGRWGEAAGYCYFTVNSLPTTPTGLSTEGLGCGSQSAPVTVSTSTPKLHSIPSDPDGGNVTARYQFYTQAGALLKEWKVAAKSGVTASTPVASGLVSADGVYKWRVVTDDAFASSAWSGYCWVKVDTTAPEPPDVVQLTTDPVPGGSVEFEFVGGSDVKSFEYSFNNGTKKTVSASTGETKIGMTLPSTGSIDHTLQVWARDFTIGGTGNVSSPTTYLFTAIEAQPAAAASAWRFDGDLLDDAGDNALSNSSTAVFAADAVGRSDAAARFDGSSGSCLTADRTIIDTTASFTAAAWVNPDAEATTGRLVFSISGEVRSNLQVLVSPTGEWRAAIASSDGTEYSWVVARTAASSVEYGTWTHVAAVYDAAAERIRLYIDGDLQGSTAVPFEQWQATGLLSVGCGALKDGTTYGSMTGSIDDAVVFQQALTGDQIAELMDGQHIPSVLQAWYPLRGDGADASGRGTDLTAMPEVPSWVQDQHGRSTSALEFDGATCPTAGTVPVRTDDSFSVSAWVRLDSDHATNHPPVFAFHGESGVAAFVKYNGTQDRWEFVRQAADSSSASFAGAVSAATPVKDSWTQLTAAYDAETALFELYVDGELSGTRTLPDALWRSVGLSIGCYGTASSTSVWEGAISDVRVWRGALDADQVAAVHIERLSAWPLSRDSGGSDEWSDADLTFTGDTSWEVDRWNYCWAAYGLDLTGTGYASTESSVIRSDESFTVAAWAKIDDNNSHHVVISQTTHQSASFYLTYFADVDTWQFALKNMGADGASWVTVESDEAVEVGRWYHLSATYDLGSNEMRLYVDGELRNQVSGPEHPWHAEGQLLLGAAGDTAGGRWSHMAGSIDQVQTWSGALDPLSIAAIAANRPKFELDPNAADCGDSPEPPGDL
ncbi:LamG domain-containing protein [Glycomyces sp. TRM65418]|uniref:LamG domain-containing protein n=1 Tax=Glycomyces sp. TRM65418 TaxID=2867006 RepID=UPI001CE6501F|nr:LamG domain-containing protein [Glycomyces sp. TRM65418]MCC3763009.1 LamG domain-containing protein [Glycomyces sp. TRM65418]QZD57025.1 LamG domain-containing protein [Glycomyces sp. TRM65418]